MKIVFLTTLAGAVTYLPGDLVEYLDPFEAYRLIKAGTARAPTKDELSLNTWLRSTRELVRIANADAAAELEATNAAALAAKRAAKRAKGAKHAAALAAKRRLELEARRARERRAYARYLARLEDAEKLATRKRRRASYVKSIRQADAATDAAALAAGAAARAARPRKRWQRRHTLTTDERLVIAQLYEQEKIPIKALANFYEVSATAITRTINEKR